MRVLWLVNIMLPAYARRRGMAENVREGWLTGLYERVQKDRAAEGLTLAVCFPGAGGGRAEMIDGVAFYAFAEDLARPERYDRKLEARFAEIIDDFRPDLVHIFGTEFPHALAMARAFNRPERLLTGLQGICTEIAKCYRASLPDAVWTRATIRDILKRDSLVRQQEHFRARGVRERSTLLLSGHVTGRTAFDREFTRRLVPQAVYHHMNETMRASFYSGSWKRENARTHGIFVAQGDYPLKGLHFLLRGLPALIRLFPDVHVTVAGNRIIKDRVRTGAYGEYLQYLIAHGNLAPHVTFTGPLSEEEMKARYLQSHVFVCASVLENSPNSLAEAMLLGVPCVASDAGGITSLLTDEKEGLVFPAGNTEHLLHAIRRLFSDDALCGRLSAAARERAHRTHDRETNVRRLYGIYAQIAEDNA